MPSLHSAYPLLAFLFVRKRWPRVSWFLLAWSAAIWFAVVYLGHHYVIDVVAGMAFAIGAYWILQNPAVSRFASRLAAPLRRRREPPAVPSTLTDTASHESR
jgi:membrane-associated phospholipid phosphatase